MPRFPRTQGPSSETVVQRFDPTVAAADAARAHAVEIAVDLEERRATGLRRELFRLSHKHGAGSEPARRAEARLVAHARSRAVLEDEAIRVRIGPVDPGPDAVIVHGRVLDQARAPLVKVTVGITDDSGRLLLADVTDEVGYFRLDSGATRNPDPKDPRQGPGQRLPAARFARTSPLAGKDAGAAGKAADEPGGRLRLVVLEKEREIHREDLAELFPGEARYREIVIGRSTRGAKTRR